VAFSNDVESIAYAVKVLRSCQVAFTAEHFLPMMMSVNGDVRT